MLGLAFGVWSVTGAGLLDSAGVEGRSSGFRGSTSFREGLAGGGALLNFLLRFFHVDLSEAGDINESGLLEMSEISDGNEIAQILYIARHMRYVNWSRGFNLILSGGIITCTKCA